VNEQWRAVPSYEGYYEVSDQGRVRSLERRAANGRVWPGIILKGVTHPNGHRQVILSRHNVKRTYWVHALVLSAIVGPAPKGMEALHRDGDPGNNTTGNLKWGTHSENMQDQVRHGVHFYAAKTHCPQGHAYDEANTYNEQGATHRKCRECMRAQNKRTSDRRRLERAARRAA
jgi:Zn ribbon nucleic-acid-binding protein